MEESGLYPIAVREDTLSQFIEMNEKILIFVYIWLVQLIDLNLCMVIY